MKKYKIEVDNELNKLLEENAKKAGTSIEHFIGTILSRFVIAPHTMDSEEVKAAYRECGGINLDWANL